MEHNIHKQHKYKYYKYEHVQIDIKTHNTIVCAFEVIPRGTLTNENIARLSLIHKYLKKHSKKNIYQKHNNALSTLSSYYIFTARPGTRQPSSTPPSRIQTSIIQ